MTQAKVVLNKVVCTYCGEDLRDPDERRNPPRDEAGEVMCDECYGQHYQGYCDRCQDKFDLTELRAEPGNLIAMFREAPALASADLTPGFYRVVRWPFFHDGMIEGYFVPDALNRVADLDELATRSADNAQCCAGPLCGDCRDHIERLLEAEAA